jgi:Vps52 / Sac2 family
MADADRSSLFGRAATRNAGRANPYAAADSTAPVPATNPFAEKQPAVSSEDASRDALLAGGKKREEPMSFSAVDDHAGQQPISEIEPLDNGDVDFDFDGLNLMETAGLTGSDIGRRTTSSHFKGGLEGSGSGSSATTTLAALEEELAADGGEGGGLGLDLDAFMAQDEVIRDALSRGVDLRLYSKQVDAELRAMELLSIRDYVSQADAVAALFEQIEHCEGVLTGMQGMLSSFQDNLGGISREIRTLQEQSLSLSVQMSNRKGLAKKIDTFLSKVSLPEQLILRIVDGQVDEGWMRGPLMELGEKLSYVQHQAAASSSSHGTGATDDASASLNSLRDLTVNPFSTPVGRESLPQLEKLRVTACAKLRNYLLKAMQELTKPNHHTNMAKTQEYVLLKYSSGMTFLGDYGGEIGREVRAYYVESVGRHYGEIFKKYWEDLTKTCSVSVGGGSGSSGTGAGSGAAGAGATALTCVLAPGAMKSDTLTDYNPQARLNAAVAVSRRNECRPAARVLLFLFYFCLSSISLAVRPFSRSCRLTHLYSRLPLLWALRS